MTTVRANVIFIFIQHMHPENPGETLESNKAAAEVKRYLRGPDMLD